MQIETAQLYARKGNIVKFEFAQQLKDSVRMLKTDTFIYSRGFIYFIENGFYTEGSYFCQNFLKKCVKRWKIQSNNYFCNNNHRYVQLVSNDFFKQKERQ